MKDFKKYLFLNEASMEMHLHRLEDKEETLYRLVNFMNKGVARKAIVKELGTGYDKDFDKIAKHLEDARTILEQIIMDIEINL